MQKRLLLLAGLALWISSAVATADDKDLLKGTGSAPPNILIVFGNSQTTEQPIQGSSSAWDGDADSPASKMGAAKAVVRRFINEKHTTFNIGMTSFSHDPNAGSITLNGKHWLYSPLTVDFPGQPWAEPIGTIERWGVHGEGPCTNQTVPACTNRSPNLVTLPAGAGVDAASSFFGSGGTGTAYICLDGTRCHGGSGQNKDNATKRVRVTLTAGKYGDAYTDGSLSTLTRGTDSMEVTKFYEVKTSGSWGPGSLGQVTVSYVPSPTLTKPDLFYSSARGDTHTQCEAWDQDPACRTCLKSDYSDCGNAVGFLNDPQSDIDVNANCSGWEFQKSQTGPASNPLIKIPRDYFWGPNCAPPQNSYPCAARLLRPQAKLVHYDQTTGAFTTTDPDNPGYTGPGNKYADGCDSTLMGAADPSIGLDITENQAIMITRNGSQAPIKNLLINILNYFNAPNVDGFENGTRADDPNATCRNSGVILIYDNFNGCQNDTCSNLTKAALTQLKQIGVPVYVIGFGLGVGLCEDDNCAGWCIANHSGAVKADKSTPGYYGVEDGNSLFLVLSEIASLLNESPQTFSSASVSGTQAQGDQMAYLASFSPTKERSIWTGRLNGYKLDPTTGFIQVCQSLPQTPCSSGLGEFTIKDLNDPHKGATIPFPSSASVLTNPSNPSLIWNAGQNLRDTLGTGATVSSAILSPNATLSHGTYNDISNDTTTTVPTNFYPGRKIVFSLPQGYTSPVTTLPIPAGTAVPETRHDMIFPTCPGNPVCTTWWPDLKALLGPQTSPPAVLTPALTDTDAGNSLRFIWGDRDAVTGTTDAAAQYGGQKLGDIFHSGPLLVGRPNDFAFFLTNVQNYQSFFNTYQNRRRVLYAGANDGLLHAFDAGAVGRDSTVPNGYDLGTGAELFAFAPRGIMQIYKPLKDAVGPQTKQDEWTVDLSPSAADVFIDASFSTTPNSDNRAWHTVLVSGMREGSPFEGTSGSKPSDSQGSYFALDITQPDELTGSPAVESPGTFNAPKCLNQSGDGTCARDWPTVLWEISDSCGNPCTSATGDLDASGSPGFGYPDMGETWSKPAMGRVKVCTANCDTRPVNEDHYVAIFGGGFDRERLNRRGNWLYMVDVETGMTLYKANSTCGGDPVISSCTPTYFGSIPSGPTAVDFNGDGYLDLIYVGDLKGQLWRIDLTRLQKLSSAPVGRFRNQLDLAAGSGAPFLFFQAGPASLPSTCAPSCLYSMYHRPDAINLGYNVGGRPALGLAFGTGDRDDIRATIDPASLTYPQRFYYVVDTANTTTTRESDLTDITTPTTGVCSGGPNPGTACTDSTVCGTGGSCSAVTTSVSAKGWMLELINGERVVGDTLTVGGIIRFPAFNPPPLNPPGTVQPCNNVNKCGSLASGISRLYSVFYTNGNAYPVGSSDRGQTQTNATFITGVTGYIGGTGGASGLYWSGGVQNPTLGVGRKITVRSWKEKTSRP